MQLNDVMVHLHADLRLPPPQPDAGGAYTLRLDTVQVTLRPCGESAFIVQSQLGLVDVEDADTLAALLQASQPAPCSAGAVLGLNLDGQVFIAQRVPEDNLAYPRFRSGLERFIGRAEAWQHRLAAGSPALVS